MRLILLFSALLLTLLTACSYKRKITAEDIVLSPVYSSGMIFKTSPKTVIHGKADPGGTLAVRINNFIRLAQTDETGNWAAEFPRINANRKFSIRIEGKDTSIVLSDILSGRVIILAGDGNLPLLFDSLQNEICYEPKQVVKVCSPATTLHNPHQNNSGENAWIPYDEVCKRDENAYLEEIIEHFTPLKKIPLGIINLSWPGSYPESWMPENEVIHANTIFSINQSVRKEILTMKDTCFEGLKKGASRLWYDDNSWRNATLPIIIGEKDNTGKKRIVYLRKKIYVSSQYLTSHFYINLEHVHGDAHFYFNETPLTPTSAIEGKTLLDIPDSLMKIWSNILTIRLFCPDSMAGIYGSDFVCYNTDSSYFRTISADWKYTFNLETEFPEFNSEGLLPGMIYQSMFAPCKNVDAECIVFQFRNQSINQSNSFPDDLCAIYQNLPGSWNKVFASHSFTYTDTLIYGIYPHRIDSLTRRLADNCSIEILEIKNSATGAE
jgi:sialate O-acetylesterase